MSERLPVEFEYLNKGRSQIDDAIFAGFLEESGAAVYLEQASRAVHTYVAGVSGSGKSRFLQALIFQDIAKGHPLCLIDPMGDLYTAVRDYIATGVERAARRGLNLDEVLKRFVFLDLTDEQNPVRINPLEPNGVETSEQQVDDLMAAVQRLLGNLEEQRKLRNILRGVFMMIAELNRLPVAKRPRLPSWCQDSFPLNLFFAPEILNVSDEERGALMAALGSDSRLRFRRQYWEFYASISQSEKTSISQSSWNVFQYLLDDTLVRRVLNTNQSTVHLEDILRSGKTLLCHLPIGENLSGASFLGRFITTKLQRAAYRRPQTEWGNGYYLYIDEFQHFVDQTFADAMTNLRKFGLRLINAHQSQSQPPFDTPQGHAFLNTIKANSRIKTVFRLDRADAETMSKELFTITAPRVSHYAVDQTESYTEQRAINVAYTFTITEGTATTWSRSHSETLGRTRTLGVARTLGTNIGKTLMKGTGGSSARSLANAISHSESEGVTEAFSQSQQMSVAIGTNFAQVRDHRRGLTLTRGSNGALSVQQGHDRSLTQSEQQSETRTSGINSGSSDSKSETLTHGQDGSIAYYSDGTNKAATSENNSMARVRNVATSQERNFSTAVSNIQSAAHGLTEKRGLSSSTGWKLDQATNISAGESLSEGGSEVQTRGNTKSHTRGTSSQRSRSETETESQTETESWNQSTAHAFSLLDQVSKTFSEALQESSTETEGVSLSERRDFGSAEQVGESESVGRSMNRTRRQAYYSLEEKRELAINQLQQLGARQCFVSTEALNTQLLETPYVPDQQYAYLAQNFPRLMIQLQKAQLLSASEQTGISSETKVVALQEPEEQESESILKRPNNAGPFLD